MIEIEEAISLFKELQCNCCHNAVEKKTIFNVRFSIDGTMPLTVKLCEDCMNQLHDLIEDTRPTYLTFD